MTPNATATGSARSSRAGHEVGHHGYTHRSPTALTRAEEESELTRGLEILRELGADVVGYRSPSWDFSPHTLELLGAHGFEYSSNLMDDIRPYRHPGGIVEVPVSWLLDDAPHFWFAGDTWNKTIRTVGEVYALWKDELDGIAALGAHYMLTMHPQFIGRPSRLALLDRVLSDITAAWEGGSPPPATSPGWSRDRRPPLRHRDGRRARARPQRRAASARRRLVCRRRRRQRRRR